MRKIYISLVMLLMSSFAIAMPFASVSADSATDSACAAINCDDTSQGPSVTSLLSLVLNVLSFLIGFVAVIMIVYNGFRFVASGGESAKVAAARSGIVYALIGLAVAALAQVMVHFVINQLNSSQNPVKTPTAAQCKKNPKTKGC